MVAGLPPRRITDFAHWRHWRFWRRSRRYVDQSAALLAPSGSGPVGKSLRRGLHRRLPWNCARAKTPRILGPASKRSLRFVLPSQSGSAGRL